MGTKYRRGFKAEANEYAREFREELGLRHYEPLSPWALAEHLLIPVISLSDLEEQEPDKVNHLIYADPQCFSAATVFNGSKRLIIVNEAHSEGRQASNLSHELAHGILGHPPTEPFNEIGCRNFHKELEAEADWLGPALLISEEAALSIAKLQMDFSRAARQYGCTKHVVQMRVNVTGALKRVRVAT